ncbi:type 2 isopentenyl-diphosphate Delta-isomerase [Paenibacillus glycanilyticus]|uniref:type 2 isopentenyl-diphosphate Delta-isomerase n=1 Tax=Paenibacillus glycanilyticus TaxID=126569 RepID=UPI0020418EB7|nr:type 2 isopentenyl-diphosphate Delta-isomerase [Paenibacillus glycanilyticus]MCM3630047.1 type 2 isopentenyl-diphosphate Delta-isomerase [Paenibacillus glycanilyticus]
MTVEQISGASASTSKRKSEHIRICLQENVAGEGIDTGFEQLRFRHNALPEIAFDDVLLDTEWLGRQMRTPLLVSSMTGGTSEAGAINRRLAEAAETQGWAIGLGSMRAAIEQEELAASFYIRDIAPSVPVIANLGAVQLNYGYGVEACRRAVEIAEADALVLHLNSMQEVFQPEGDTNFRDLLPRIEEVCRSLSVPVGIKEVGWGIDADTAAALASAGAAFIDVAGAGGTSWSQVEKYRQNDPMRRLAAEAFAGWGIPTAQSIMEVKERLPHIPVVASGGLQHGVDAAKSIALGADIAGFGRALLPRAANDDTKVSVEQLIEQFERIEFELRAAMFGIGAATITELQHTSRLIPAR